MQTINYFLTQESINRDRVFQFGAILEYPATYLHIPERFIERGI